VRLWAAMYGAGASSCRAAGTTPGKSSSLYGRRGAVISIVGVIASANFAECFSSLAFLSSASNIYREYVSPVIELLKQDETWWS